MPRYLFKRNYKLGRLRHARMSPGGAIATSGGGPPAANLQLWLKADAITGLNDGDRVTTWIDSSGNSRDATQSVAADKPTYKTNILNGKPVVRFAASNSEFMNLPDFLTGFSAGEIFIVVKLNNDPPAVGDGGIWNFGSDGIATHYCYIDGVVYDEFATTARKDTGNQTPSLAAWRLYNISSQANEWTSRLDGTQVFTTATNTVGWTTSPTIGTSTVGATPTYYCDGDIAELLLYSAVLSASDRTAVKTYIAAKYNLTLA